MIYRYQDNPGVLFKLIELARKRDIALDELSLSLLADRKLEMRYGPCVESLETMDFYTDEFSPRGIHPL